jgi:cell wall-associated NlpC family hydrolase
VQWSFARAGVVMPRVAADQARTGPAIPFSRAQAGDLLFYRTDPTAPDYISHVAIYLGRGLMIQAPEPGENVQIVPVALGSEFAGAVRVSPATRPRCRRPGGLTSPQRRIGSGTSPRPVLAGAPGP